MTTEQIKTRQIRTKIITKTATTYEDELKGKQKEKEDEEKM